MSRSGPDPERLFYGKVVGTARLLAVEQGPIAAAITRIRETAQGRNDLLTEAAGIGLGAWSVNPGHPVDLLTASSLPACSGSTSPSFSTGLPAGSNGPEWGPLSRLSPEDEA